MQTEAVPNEINIGDVIRLALPFETTVLGDASQTRRPVNWVVVLSGWDNPAEQATPNDLALVPPSLMEQLAPARTADLLAPFAELPLAGLILFGKTAPEIGQLVTALDLPLLVVPPPHSVRDVHHAVSQLLVNRQSATSERAMQLYRQLSAMSREGQGLAAMTEFMSKLTGNIIVVQDKRMEVQAASWPPQMTVDREALIQALQNREQLPPVLRNRKAAAKARQSYWQQLLPLENMGRNMGRLISPIISGDRARGYLSVVAPASELDLLDSLTVEHGAVACALEMAKAKAVSEVKKELRGNFLEGLLAGTLQRKEIDRLESRLDHNTQEPHAVITYTWVGKTTPTLRRLETILHWVLNNHHRPALVHIYGQQHIVVFQALRNEQDMDTVHQLNRRILEQVESEFPEANILGGLSGPARTLADWPRVYEEALQAMQLGQRLKLNRQLVEFGSLGVYRLLYELDGQAAVQKFTDEIMNPLATYDAENRGSLVKTVQAYFEHHGNISQTAESLFVHRNTLLYRMDRIQELTGLQLEQANMRLALHLALKLWQLRPES